MNKKTPHFSLHLFVVVNSQECYFRDPRFQSFQGEQVLRPPPPLARVERLILLRTPFKNLTLRPCTRGGKGYRCCWVHTPSEKYSRGQVELFPIIFNVVNDFHRSLYWPTVATQSVPDIQPTTQYKVVLQRNFILILIFIPRN